MLGKVKELLELSLEEYANETKIIMDHVRVHGERPCDYLSHHRSMAMFYHGKITAFREIRDLLMK